MRCVSSVVGFALLCVICGGCGNSSSDSPTPTAQIIQGMSAAQRAQYCFLYVTPESDNQARQAFITQLQGTWDYFPNSGTSPGDVPSEDDNDKKTFDFDTKRDVATLTEYSLLGKNIEDIAWNKLCISQPLGSDQGAFAGFRMVEMMANDNSGAAAVAVKIAPGPVLFLSDYYYQPDATDALTDLPTALSNMSNIWEYSTKEP